MSEKTVECSADVTRYMCSSCADECIWIGKAEKGELGDDGKIKTLTFVHHCKCEGKFHHLDKIYPIVKLKEETPLIQLLN
jgi:hypothetical protein